MVRLMAVVVLALAVSPTPVRAQDTALTVTVPSADVHKGPSNVTPVIGHVSRGTALPVSRNLGSWVKVAWPDAADGVGYVHVTMGRLGSPSADAPAATMSPRSSSAPASATSAPAPAPPPIPLAIRKPATERMAVRGELNGTPITHIFALAGWSGQGAALVRPRARGATTISGFNSRSRERR